MKGLTNGKFRYCSISSPVTSMLDSGNHSRCPFAKYMRRSSKVSSCSKVVKFCWSIWGTKKRTTFKIPRADWMSIVTRFELSITGWLLSRRHAITGPVFLRLSRCPCVFVHRPYRDRANQSFNTPSYYW